MRSFSNFELHDRYTQLDGDIWLNGLGAVARLPLDQQRLDRQAGNKTAGYISGYRGSPLGGLDLELGQVSTELEEAGVVFQSGVNEDLAATAICGTQQVNLFPNAKYDGIYAMWYGKAPGLDRSADAIRHANLAGTHRFGGVLAMVGDDPSCQSSTLPSFSGGLLRDLRMPVLDPANIEDLLEFGLYGWALSRYSGLWVGMLTQSALLDAATTIQLNTNPKFHAPPHTFNPHIRLDDTPVAKEQRLAEKQRLVDQFQASNPLTRIYGAQQNPKLTIVSSGMNYTNLRQTLYVIGFRTEQALQEKGIQVIKLGITWPVDRAYLERLALDASYIFVVEHGESFIETQLKSFLYRRSNCPIAGKSDENDQPLLSTNLDLKSKDIAIALARVFAKNDIDIPQTDYLQRIEEKYLNKKVQDATADRKPLFCSGCPHARSTQIPEGSLALAGIGCHYMVQWMDRNTYTFTQMGGEGANWIGQFPFSETNHVFVNLGDGTYQHSGLMAIRAAVTANVNVTYKILFNDVVAMTGGQTVDGSITVENVVAQVKAEGVREVVVLSNEPEKYKGVPIKVKDRSELDAVQKDLREIPGVTVLIYDQTCSNELRRRRTRKLVPQSKKHVFINEAVCEGCGDCTNVSLCSAIAPLETPLGTKREINQTLCNQDMSCLDGHCPALVEVQGTKKARQVTTSFEYASDEVEVPESANIIIAGVGGTGIITLSRILSCAAWIDGKKANSLDQSGLAQKGGAVMAHIRIHPSMLHHTYIPEGNVDLLIGTDPVTATSQESLRLASTQRTKALLNMHVQPSMKFVLDREREFQSSTVAKLLESTTLYLKTFDANQVAEWVTGSSTATNMLMLGYAWQLGWIPLQKDSILRAIELNHTAVEINKQVFEAGRSFAEEKIQLSQEQTGAPQIFPVEPSKVGDQAPYFADILSQYSGRKLRERFLHKVASVKDTETRIFGECRQISEIVAKAYFKVLYRKDEFEVARLLLHENFQKNIQHHMSSGYRITYSFGSPWLTKLTGKDKVLIGGWFRPILQVLSRCKGLRDTAFNPFQYASERKLDQIVIDSFEDDLTCVLSVLNERDKSDDNVAVMENCLRLLGAYERVIGYGRIRQKNWDAIQQDLVMYRKNLTEPSVDTSQPNIEKLLNVVNS